MINEKLENEIFISKIIDKINFCRNRNTIEYTDFLDINQKSIAIDVLKSQKFNTYIINNNEHEFDRNIIIMYPEKLDIQIAEKYYEEIISFIKIENSKNDKYEHRVYLSGIMKTGIKREKFGDIIVNENGASIIVFKELSNYLFKELRLLKRFQKSNISINNIDKLILKEKEFEDINIIVHSLRLDNFVSELAKCSRTKAKEIIENSKVFINGKCEEKISKNVNVNDIITIRGIGKFIFDRIENKTKKDNFILNLRKYK